MIEKAEQPVPIGFTKCYSGEVDVFENDKQFVFLGEPDKEHPEKHNCDSMGCGSLDHVIFRFRKATK